MTIIEAMQILMENYSKSASEVMYVLAGLNGYGKINIDFNGRITAVSRPPREGTLQKVFDTLFPTPSTPSLTNSEKEANNLTQQMFKAMYAGSNKKQNKNHTSNTCECGADKTGALSHSHWCPKGEK